MDVAAGSHVILARTTDGTIYELSDGRAVDPPLIHPTVLSETESPRFTAATEWRGQLFLAYEAQGRHHVAIYDSRRLQWQKLELGMRPNGT